MLQLEHATDVAKPSSEHNAPAATGSYPYKFSENTSTTLDLIRALSAQMVVVGHGISFLQIALWLHEPNFPWMQNIGVLVFFLLSGLLISHSTFSKKDRPGYGFKTFFIERFSRIYTGYVPAICLVLALDFAFVSLHGRGAFPYANDLKAVVGNLFMLEDYPLLQSQFTSLGSARPFWTLAVEWWLYMFFGCLVLRKTFGIHKILFCSLLAVSAVVPYYNSVIAGRGNGLYLVWMMGLMVAVLLKNKIAASPRLCATLATVSFICACSRTYMIKNAYDLTFAAFLMGSLYFTIRGLDQIGPVYSGAVKKIIKFTADYSFSLYLIHYSIFFFLAPLVTTTSPYLLFAAGFVGSNIIAAAMASVTEMRHRQLAKYLIAKFS